MLHNSQKTAMVRCLKGLGDYKPFLNINDSRPANSLEAHLVVVQQGGPASTRK